MIGPTSEVGRTMMSSLQGAISKGMPVEQAVTYVKSMAQQGVAPLVDLYSLLKQFERMKQPAAQPPAGGNLKDQLSNLESSIVSGGQAAPAAPPAGIASLNAGAMENPGFAGGGIVAFADGGQPQSGSITPEFYSLPKSYEELARQALAKQLELESPEGRKKFEEQLDAEMKAKGLGKYAPSLGMREAYAERKAKEAETLSGEEAALNEESFWADVAGTDQPDLISAMAKSKSKAVERKRSSKEKVQAAKDKAEDVRILRQEAREALAQKDMDLYKEKRTAAETLAKTSVTEYVKGQESAKEEETKSRNLLKYAAAQKGAEDALVAQLARTPRMVNGKPNPQYEELRQKLNDIRGAGKSATTSSQNYQMVKSKWTEASKALDTAQENYNFDDSPENRDALIKAKEEYNYWDTEFRRIPSGGGSMVQGSTELPPDFVEDPR